MKPKTIIERLIKAINENKNAEVIKEYTEVVTDNIEESAKENNFYQLPYEILSSIIKNVDFSNDDEISKPIELLQTIIQNTSKAYPKESIFLLNDLQLSKLPEMTIDSIINIITMFSSSPLLTKLGELQIEEKLLPKPDYAFQIMKLEKEIETLKKEKAQEKEIVFPPITEKPNDFEENVFVACEQGKLSSVQYHFEVLHADINAKCSRKIMGVDAENKLTVFELAIINDHLPIVRYLCEVQKVDPIKKKNYIYYLSCVYNCIDILKYFHDLPIDGVNFGSYIFIACSNGSLEVIKYLYEVKKIKPEFNHIVMSPLDIAAEHNNLEVVKYLIEVQKFDPRKKDEEGYTPYRFAGPNVKEYLESIGVTK